MSKDFLNFPDTDILLFHEPLKSSKQLLDLFPEEDPFLAYRDDSSYCGTPESALTLGNISRTPSSPDSGSLSDIPSLDPSDDFSSLEFAMDKDSDCLEEDLDFRAPFISMNMDDDFPLISPSNSVMWGPQEPKKSPLQRLSSTEGSRNPSQPRTPSDSQASLKSSLAALLQSDLKKNTSKSRRDYNNNRRYHHPDTTTITNGHSYNRNSRHRPRHSNIIMLDSIPVKSGKNHAVNGKASHKRNVGGNINDRNSAQFGSHTATVKVNDRLIKVQVSVSELPRTTMEQKGSHKSPPDPPPKRAGTGLEESPKRMKVDKVTSARHGFAKDSVLLNLLISGEDASRGYLCSGNSRYTESKPEPAVISLPSTGSTDSSSDLLSTESELLDSFLKISAQYDNDPLIHSSHLLSDELLSALEYPRNVTALG